MVLRLELLLGSALLGIACAGRGPANLGNVTVGLSVGGSYQTHVSLVPDRNTCGAVSVQDNLTVVTQSPGTLSLTVTHAGNTYQGAIDRNARFSTTPSKLSLGGNRYTITINGQFSRIGLDATVEVDVQQARVPPQCSYFVHWVCTKDGPPNTMP